MKITRVGHLVTVLCSKKAERYRNESALWYAIKKELQRKGYNCVKKRPDKDGHLTSAPYYIRERGWKWCIYDANYAIRSIAEDFNRDGIVRLTYESVIFPPGRI